MECERVHSHAVRCSFISCLPFTSLTFDTLAPSSGFCLSTLTAKGPTRTRCAVDSAIALVRQPGRVF